MEPKTEGLTKGQALGCTLLVAMACVSVGIGLLFGAAWGWIAFGSAVGAEVVREARRDARRRERAQ